jgi:hypothetical protein
MSKYSLWTYKNYGKIYTEVSNLRTDGYTVVATLRNASREIIDKVKMSKEEYEENRDKYNSYTIETYLSKEITAKIKDLELQISDISSDYRENILNMFYEDIRDTFGLSCSIEAVSSLVDSVIEKINIYMSFIEEDEGDLDRIELNFGTIEMYADRIFKLIKAEQNILNALKTPSISETVFK